MKTAIYLTLAFALMALLMSNSGCDSQPSSDEVQQKQQENILQEGTRQIGMPAIVNFQEKKTLKWIFELRDNNTILNYAYAFSEVTGKFSYIGRCVGFPIPYCTQFTNPQKVEQSYTSSFGTLPQADPNGLFSPASADGTWILLVDPKTGDPKPMYMEPKVTVTPFPLPDAVCTINAK